MGSWCRFAGDPDQVRNPNNSFSREIRHGRSKAQMSLAKILHVISNFPPAGMVSKQPSLCSEKERVLDSGFVLKSGGSKKGLFDGDGGFDVDLNIGLCPLESEEEVRDNSVVENSESPAAMPVEKISESVYGSVAVVENDNGEEESELVEEKSVEKAEVDEENDEEKGSEIVEEAVRINGAVENGKQIRGEEGNMGLLIEAAKLILGDDFTSSEADGGEKDRVAAKTGGGDEESSTRREPKRKRCSTVEELYREYELKDTSSPVVRSKGGRTRVLPCKYRDSVLEPWTLLSSRPRSTTTVSAKRRRSREQQTKMEGKTEKLREKNDSVVVDQWLANLSREELVEVKARFAEILELLKARMEFLKAKGTKI